MGTIQASTRPSKVTLSGPHDKVTVFSVNGWDFYGASNVSRDTTLKLVSLVPNSKYKGESGYPPTASITIEIKDSSAHPALPKAKREHLKDDADTVTLKTEHVEVAGGRIALHHNRNELVDSYEGSVPLTHDKLDVTLTIARGKRQDELLPSFMRDFVLVLRSLEMQN